MTSTKVHEIKYSTLLSGIVPCARVVKYSQIKVLERAVYTYNEIAKMAECISVMQFLAGARNVRSLFAYVKDNENKTYVLLPYTRRSYRSEFVMVPCDPAIWRSCLVNVRIVCITK